MRFGDWLHDLKEYRLIQGDLNVEVEDVVYDSRKARENTVFVCTKGTRVDSHAFISDVVKQGVKVLVVEEEVKIPEGVTAIAVGSARKALAQLAAARFGYPAKRMTVIGVTGTKGKTTTTHMIKAILEACGKKVGMIGTTGIVIGEEVTPTRNTTPESYELQQAFLDMANAGCEYLVMEVSSQAFKMHRVDGIQFDYGIFTNISPDHIGPDEHADFAEYLSYKSQIFSCCRIGLMNADDPCLEEVVKHADCELHYFGVEKPAEFCGDEIHYIAEPDFVGLEFQVAVRPVQPTDTIMDGHSKSDSDTQRKPESRIKMRTNIPGKFNVSNAMAAISLCLLSGLPVNRICHGLEHLSVNGRMELVYTSSRFQVIVDYAHNAVSMESLLSTLREYRPKRLVCVFGCGGNRSKDRRYSMGDSAGRLADFSILTADNSRFEKTEDIIADIRSSIEKTGGSFIEIPDRREAIFYSVTHAEEGDMIAVIGKGHEDYQEENGVRHHFLDREVILDAVRSLS